MAQAGQVARKLSGTGAFLLAAIASLLLATGASAQLSGNYARFAHCPYKSPEASKCIYSTTTGGEVLLGSAKVPIVNPAILQGAYSGPDKNGISKFIGPPDELALSKAPQPIPGGLLGIAAPADAPPLAKALIALLFENDLTKASATLELAKPPSEIRFSEENFGGEAGPGLVLPVKVHLEGALLGPSCYVGSSSSPILWALTTGKTSPPKPNKPAKGTVGKIEFLEGGAFAETQGTKLVDNAFSAPGANGCGGPLASLINPLVNEVAGLPAAAGRGAVSLQSTISIASASLVGEEAGG
jgi:hypothetical protein